jgi:hypothetical protein
MISFKRFTGYKPKSRKIGANPATAGAPPTDGGAISKGIDEALYLEFEDTFSHDGNEYDLRALNKLSTDNPIQKFKVSDLVWIFKYDDPLVDHPERIGKIEYKKPILVTQWHKKLVVLDGLHRLKRFEMNGEEYIHGLMVTPEQLKAVLKENGIDQELEAHPKPRKDYMKKATNASLPTDKHQIATIISGDGTIGLSESETHEYVDHVHDDHKVAYEANPDRYDHNELYTDTTMRYSRHHRRPTPVHTHHMTITPK